MSKLNHDPISLVKAFPDAFWIQADTYAYTWDTKLRPLAAKYPEVQKYYDEWLSISYGTKVHEVNDFYLIERRLGDLWNRERRKAFKKAGIKNPNTVNKKKNSEKAEAQRQLCIRKVTEMVNELLLYKAALEGDRVTRKRIRKVYDLTVELNSANKRLRETKGIK